MPPDFLVAIALGVPVTIVSAADADGAHSCIVPAHRTADQIAACLDDVRAAADARLNATYDTALASLDGADRSALRDAQRAWMAFRDKDRASLLTGAWRTHRDTYVRIAAAEADIGAINAREFTLRVYAADVAGAQHVN